MKVEVARSIMVLALFASRPNRSRLDHGYRSGPFWRCRAGASVASTHVETGVNFETTTNERGAYSIAALPTGKYRLRSRQRD